MKINKSFGGCGDSILGKIHRVNFGEVFFSIYAKPYGVEVF